MDKKELNQSVFQGHPQEVNWCGVDYDGDLNFGKTINPRYTWVSERYGSIDFSRIPGDAIVNGVIRKNPIQEFENNRK